MVHIFIREINGNAFNLSQEFIILLCKISLKRRYWQFFGKVVRGGVGNEYAPLAS